MNNFRYLLCLVEKVVLGCVIVMGFLNLVIVEFWNVLSLRSVDLRERLKVS